MHRPSRSFLRALFVCLLWPCIARAQISNRHAIVIGVNQAANQNLTALDFADDDAINNCLLLTDLGASPQLFTEAVGITQWKLPKPHQGQANGCAAPGLASYDVVVKAIQDLVKSIKESGRTDHVVYLWFSGHGDGNALFLEDKPLTAALLRQILIEPTRGLATVHLILDACHIHAFGKALTLAKNPHVGAFFAQTTTKEVHELSEIEAGVLSYELRAALRNAADATGDQQVSYVEAEAFVWAANVGVDDEKAQMHPAAYPPYKNMSFPLANWSHAVAVSGATVPVNVPLDAETRLRIIDARGVRVLESRRGPEPSGTPPLPLFVPRGAKLRIDRLDPDGGWSEAFPDVSAAASVDWRQLSWTKKDGKARDALGESLKRGMFMRPYSKAFYEAHLSYRQAPDSDPTGDFRSSRTARAPGPTLWPYLALSAGAAAGLTTGIVFQIRADNANQRVVDVCGPATSGSCLVSSEAQRQRLHADQDQARSDLNVSRVGFGLAGASAAAGFVLFILQPSEASQGTAVLVPSLTPHAQSLSLVGGF
jgi:hypothetical protein